MKETILHRVVTFLDRKELDFLDNITKDILFSHGIKVPRSTLLRTLIDMYVVSQNNQIKTHEDVIQVVIKRIKEGGYDV